MEMKYDIDTICWNDFTEKDMCVELDFSVNTNPLGVPTTVTDKILRQEKISECYPDPDCKLLVSCLEEKYKVSARHIVCGNGADDLLYRLVFAIKPKRAIIIEPTFEEYSRALELIGCEISHYQLKPESQFSLGSGILSALQDDFDMMFLCNPNNPTGQLVDRSFLMQLLMECKKRNTLLVVDECFMEFLPEWKLYSLKSEVTSYSNLVVIDAFTKTYSLAGFRLGFCLAGNIEILSVMKRWGQSFSVSAPAQFAGVCALHDQDYMQTPYQFLPSEREWLFQRLKTLGLDVWPSYGNYLLFRTSDKNIREKLFAKRVKVRDCSRFYGLGREYCRIAIRTHKENLEFIEILRSVLGLVLKIKVAQKDKFM